MPNPRIQVRNMRDVTAALRRSGTEGRKNLKRYLLPISQGVVAAAARKVPRRSGAAAGSLSATATDTGARVSFGGTKAPYYPWLDFGGTVGKGHEPGRSWSGSVERPFISHGRYVYPTIDEQREDIEQAAMDAILRAAIDAQLGVE